MTEEGDPNAPSSLDWTPGRVAAVLTALVCLGAQATLRGASVLVSPTLLLGLGALLGMIFWPDAIASVSVGRATSVPPAFVRAVAWVLLGSGTLATCAAAIGGLYVP